jgi:hypothetical protein
MRSKINISNFEDIDLQYNLKIASSESYLKLLKINNYRYLINYYDDNIYYCDESGLVLYHSYDKIALFDSHSGELLLLLNLFDSFVGVISFKDGLLILTDTSYFKINKSNYSIYELNFINDEIIDFEISNSSIIILKLSTDETYFVKNLESPNLMKRVMFQT